jgi:hypothetical protein
MKQFVFFLLSVFTGLLLLLPSSTTAADLDAILPIVSKHQEWQLESPAQKAEGNQLFMLINGGATLYLSLGFKRVLIATLIDKQGKPINIDIYEMNSPSIAQQVNKAKVGLDAEKLSFGKDTSLESYYLNFWQGPYQITISGYDATPASIASIIRLARLVDQKISQSITTE